MPNEQPWSEQIPGQPNQMAQLMQLFRGMGAGGGGPQQQQPQGGGMTPQQQPQQVQQARPGGFGAPANPVSQVSGMGPNQTSSSYGGPATNRVPGPGHSSQSWFGNEAEKRQVLTTNAIQGLSDVVTKHKQDQWQKEAAQAEQMWSNYVTLVQTAGTSQDPKAQQMMMQAAEQMKQDKNFVKLVEKAQKDPMSGAGVGLQRAMQTSMQQANQQLMLEKIQAEIENQRAQAQQHQAAARAETEVTPKLQAIIQGRQDVADTTTQGRKDVEGMRQEGAEKRTEMKGEFDVKKEQIKAAAKIQSARETSSLQWMRYQHTLDKDQAHDAALSYGPYMKLQQQATNAEAMAPLAVNGNAQASVALVSAFLGTNGNVGKAQFDAASKQQGGLMGKLGAIWGGPNGDQLIGVKMDQETADQMVNVIKFKATTALNAGNQMASEIYHIPTLGGQPAAPSQSGASKPDIVVSPEDMK
jgi:hypothetical protein